MQRIGTFLQTPLLDTSKRSMKHEWQAFAYKVWLDYSGNPKELPNCIKLFKKYNTTDRGKLDTAYNFCKDYTGTIPRLKLFYWKFWDLKKKSKDQKGNV